MVRPRCDWLHHRRRAGKARSALSQSRQGGVERIQAGAPDTAGGREGRDEEGVEETVSRVTGDCTALCRATPGRASAGFDFDALHPSKVWSQFPARGGTIREPTRSCAKARSGLIKRGAAEEMPMAALDAHATQL